MLRQVLARDAAKPAGEDLEQDGEQAGEQDDEEVRVAIACSGAEGGREVAGVDVCDATRTPVSTPLEKQAKEGSRRDDPRAQELEVSSCDLAKCLPST